MKVFYKMHGFVALYGGSFDPIHKGHNEIIHSLCENPLYWHIILIPNFMNPLKSTPLFSAAQRLQMCEAIAKEYNHKYPPLSSLPRISVNDYEIKQNRPVFSIESIQQIKIQINANYPYAQFVFVLGRDNLSNMHKWHKPKDLCEMVKFVLINRLESKPTQLDSKLPFAQQVITPEVIECIELHNFGALSSSTVRILLKNGDINSALDMIPENLHSMIKTYFKL
ncbi:nicotinate-nicotinamide nucleotide adenylyltransferase [Helicobacter muridarum]|uniref:Probable nicotinate-nucleotide adenylyltransferase n=1 Tax=Helicobacter muridarum TaxID=216 RepID=A0A099TV36_9HELI|nr:nicotinate-nicotinamide nucleotide adenylyltransferase [Helicobacter muridarum]TLE01669.1 nicotinate-nicotinamide nucleotide adenylyltransferase [Helicobacter muridarum]STQ86296.1 nicotinate-nucleotide adenylyltransferase [Helicobacter muridarum]